MRNRRMTAAAARRSAWTIAVAVLAAPTPGSGQAIIDNGTVQLGVDTRGQLNIAGGTSSAGGSGTTVGIRHVPTNYEGTAGGCDCEGWGAGDTTSAVSGGVDNAVGIDNVAPVSFLASGTGTLAESVGDSAVAVTDIGTTLRVTHDYHPSVSPNLYEVTVTIENLSGATVTPVYRRLMDWDVEPTIFSELVTIEVGTSTALYYSNDNGFRYPNPLFDPSPPESLVCGITSSFTDCGPGDHGALFDFAFDPLDPGESVTFQVYYGAAATETEALGALSAVGAEVFSLGQCDSGSNAACDASTGTPVTFIFGFTGVGGEPIFPECSIDPLAATNPVGSLHEVTATVTSGGSPVEGVTVDFEVVSGPHAGETGSDVTSALGEAGFSYTGTSPGSDSIEASGEIEGQPFSCFASKQWASADTGLEKAIVAGPDVDGVGGIDRVVAVGSLSSQSFDFRISYSNPGGPDVVILDSLPAEWGVTLPDDDGGRASVAKANKKIAGSSSKITWTPDPEGGSSDIVVRATTRKSPGRRNPRYAPTSCGALYLNHGAVAYELDEAGSPISPPLFGPTPELCLAAVRDLDGGGLVGDGSGDEDGDGASDWQEACVDGTDPCVAGEL